jgi:OOP family OmpA-OmpF porin
MGVEVVIRSSELVGRICGGAWIGVYSRRSGGLLLDMRYCILLMILASALPAADVPGSKDPAGMKRYEGSEIIGYRAPKFDEFLLPLGAATAIEPPAYEKSIKTEGLISRYAYVAPSGRTTTELLRNYKLEFQRLGLITLYEKAAGGTSLFGATTTLISREDDLGQILEYNEAQERLLVAKSKDAKPTYYYVFVTSYNDGVVPDRLQGVVVKNRALAMLVVIAPEKMEEKMTMVNAAEMAKSLTESGKIALYGINFDTDKDVLRPDSQSTIQEIANLLKGNTRLNVRIVGHSDNQGKPEYNLDLSRRRALSVVRELTSRYGIAANRLDAFGCGLYAPIESNETEAGRAKNRRVELVKW